MNVEKPSKNIIKKFTKKALQIGVLSTALTNSPIFTSCVQPTKPYVDIVNQEQTQDIVSRPYDKRIGNGNYQIHNFIGKEPEIQHFTAYEDIQNYYDMGEKYIEDTYAKFHRINDGRESVENYFYGYTLQNSRFDDVKKTKGKVIDRMIDQIAIPSAYYIADIVRHLDNATDREAFILCYATLDNEAYREGLSDKRDTMDKYYARRNQIENAWNKNDTLQDIDYAKDVDNRNCRQTTNQMDILLDRASNKMYSESNIDVFISDLRNVVNIALLTSTLTAMHDYTATTLEHTECVIKTDIYEAMYNAHHERKYTQLNSTEIER